MGNRNLSNLQFKDYSGQNPGNTKRLVALTYAHDDPSDIRLAGEMTWGGSDASPPGEISDIRVESEYRRQGVATAMYNYAKANYDLPPQHSSERTEAGTAWAESTGDPVPKLTKRMYTR